MKRVVNLLKLLAKKSHFLFGPRACGKTYLIESDLKDRAEVINLLDSDQYLTLIANPSNLRAIIDASKHPIIVIDEIQRIPELLNEVHLYLENRSKKPKKFLLTGSSARKLKNADANLLGGRVRKAELFPFCSKELKDSNVYDLDKILSFGTLPLVYLGNEPFENLRDYVDVYLNEEISRECNVRNLPNFSRFLTVAALSSGELINYTKIANDSQNHPNTVREYFQILIDTLLGFTLEPWGLSKKRKAIQTAKAYLFDVGVTRAICNLSVLQPNTNEYGKAFEQFIALELRAYKSYFGKTDQIYFWRTSDQIEVDFIIGDHTAIEVKASKKVSTRDHKGLLKLKEEKIIKNFLLVSLDPIPMRFETGIEHIHIDEFQKRLWEGELF